mmetsp:Transcript_59345/g.158666  ORF Transcript_59345/g.158666 Transcript_59345/m.158666 type:complete len:296 (-) Transcript_59345:129-1016(-)
MCPTSYRTTHRERSCDTQLDRVRMLTDQGERRVVLVMPRVHIFVDLLVPVRQEVPPSVARVHAQQREQIREDELRQSGRRGRKRGNRARRPRRRVGREPRRRVHVHLLRPPEEHAVDRDEHQLEEDVRLHYAPEPQTLPPKPLQAGPRDLPALGLRLRGLHDAAAGEEHVDQGEGEAQREVSPDGDEGRHHRVNDPQGPQAARHGNREERLRGLVEGLQQETLARRCSPPAAADGPGAWPEDVRAQRPLKGRPGSELQPEHEGSERDGGEEPAAGQREQRLDHGVEAVLQRAPES